MWIWSDELVAGESGGAVGGAGTVPLVAYAVTDGTDLAEFARRVLADTPASSHTRDRESRDMTGRTGR